MKLKFSSFLILFIVVGISASFAQMKVVIMGSSTAYGTGASVYDSSWAGRITAFLNRNTTDGADTVFNNIAFPAYDTYQEMPTGFIPPVGRPTPDEDYNVTKALSYTPNVVIINLPSNDINYGYAKAEMMSNLRVMYDSVVANGAVCFVATPQPRNDISQDYRDSLRTLVDSVNITFGPQALDFWDGLVTTDGLNMLKEEYAATGSELHLNDAGHELLFERVRDAYIFGIAGPVALHLTSLAAQPQGDLVLISWHTEQQGPNTSFEVQRSNDGQNFETAFTQTITEARPSFNYTGTDQTPFAGKSFYRIKIAQAGRISYSPIVTVNSPVRSLNIANLYLNTALGLTAVIGTQKSQVANYIIINTTGAVLISQKIFINSPGTTLNFPVSKLPAGQYYFRIFTEDGTDAVKAFTK